MKILHVAVFTPKSTNPAQSDGFMNLGHQVIRYDYRQRARDLGYKLHTFSPKRDSELVELCQREHPDIILFAKCNSVHIDVVRSCNKIGATVLWFPDFDTSIDDELVEKFKVCNYIFCSRWDGINVARKYNENVYRLQGGFNSKVHRPFDIPKRRDVVFIGGLRNRSRIEYRKAVNFEVVGNVYNEKHSRIVSETKINLNFTKGDGTSNRIYKLMAAGGFVLTQPWYRMGEDFEISKDLDVFRTPEELRSKIKYYLKHEEEREKIAEYGFKTVQKYDNNNYAKKIIEKISR